MRPDDEADEIVDDERKEIVLKCGKDSKLEADANKWLSGGRPANKRSVSRDVEKMAFEGGHISRDELRHYDPENDWKTTHSVFTIAVDPGDADSIDPTISVAVDDGNIRSRNPQMLERQALMRHVEDTDRWGSTEEDIPPLGSEGPRKTCTRCRRAKGIECFYAQPRNRDGLSSWCKPCQKSINGASNANLNK